MLAESLDGEMYLEPNSEENELKKAPTIYYYLVEPDKKKLMEYLTEIKAESGEDDIDVTFQMEKFFRCISYW